MFIIKETNMTTEHAHPYAIGAKVLIRTVTHYYTGRIDAVYNQEIVLSTPAWIADTGRFSEAFERGISGLSEIEPMPSPIIIGRGAIIDVAPWHHDLPTEKK